MLPIFGFLNEAKNSSPKQSNSNVVISLSIKTAGINLIADEEKKKGSPGSNRMTKFSAQTYSTPEFRHLKWLLNVTRSFSTSKNA